jgi:hypothetical protein
MEELVARLNIDHFRKALATTGDDKTKQRTLLRLLAEEEAKLAAIKIGHPCFHCHNSIAHPLMKRPL